MRKIDLKKLVKIIGLMIIAIYMLALWFNTVPVSACTLNAGISKQLDEYDRQLIIPLAGFSKEVMNMKEYEPFVEENEQVIVKQSIGIEKDVPPNNSFKSYMDADISTSRNTDQYKLKAKYIIDEQTGIWTVDERYCIAVGSYYTQSIGTYIDVVMENGNVLHCILGECKRNCDTDYTNRQNNNGSVVEFIVNTSSTPSMVRKMGNCSYACEEMKGEIKSIIVYD